MRLSVVSLAFAALTPLVSAIRVIESSSLNACMSNSSFTADLFNIALTPDNSSASFTINGFSAITGYVVANVELMAYGFTIVNQTVDPCAVGLNGFCPMSKSQLTLESNIDVPADTLARVPGVGYAVPDLDGVVRVTLFQVSESGGIGTKIACLEANLSNTKSVYQKAVGWVTAIIAGLGLIAAGITSGLGNTNTAAHVAANAVSLFGVFQAQALIGMTSVTMPPIVQSWTQNFQWSMGIIRVGFMQRLATWYQRATGGTPTTYLSTLSTYSVEVQKKLFARRLVKKSVDVVVKAIPALAKRASDPQNTTQKSIIVRGIDRVGFRAGIEQTNIFMTGLIFFAGILVITALLVTFAKIVIEGAAKAGWMKSDKFREFRNGWRIVIKGILFRLILLGFVQMATLCLWQLTERDSAAEIVLAIFVFLSMAGALAWASFKVVSLAKRSVTMHKNPAYILYSDPTCLNKWGFLYVSYKATSYYFVIVLLAYTLVKAIFIAFAQKSPVGQAIGLVIVEATFLIGVSILKPWMDKKTNIFNIAIAAINFINAIFLLVFSDAFGQPPMVSGVMGVIFALYNVIFIIILLIMVLVASIYAIVSKNPETRYQPMRDDRGSFIKSQAALTTELDALGVTARGDPKAPFAAKEMDDESLSSVSLSRPPTESRRPMSMNEKIGAHGQVSSAPPPQFYQQATTGSGYSHERPSTAPQGQDSGYARSSPAPYQQAPRSSHGGYGPQSFSRPISNNSNKPAVGSTPWQRGAGYD